MDAGNYTYARRTQQQAESLRGCGVSVSHRVSEPLLRLNALLVRLPLDSISQIDARADARANYGALNFYNQLSVINQNTISVAVYKNVTNCLVLGLVAGVTSGMTLGPVIGGIFWGGLGAFFGFILGTTISGVVGAISGIAAGCIQTAVIIQQDLSYQEWIAEQKLQLRYESYQEYIQAYFPTAAEFLCPISLDFPQTPVRSPNGHVYDKQAIEEYLDMKEARLAEVIQHVANEGRTGDPVIEQRIEEIRNTFCPFRGPYFTKDQLVYDRDFALRMRRKLNELIGEMSLEERHRAIGMEILIASLKKTENMVMSQKIALLYQQMGPLGLSLEQQSECIQRVLNENG